METNNHIEEMKEHLKLCSDTVIKNSKIIKEVKGSDLIGKSYEPVFDYYKNIDMPNKENIWKVWHADFVTIEKGTGIAHEAPAFGEEDMGLAKEHNIPIVENVLLARTLYKTVKVGAPVPRSLYKTVAEVLAFVYKLKKKDKALA